VEPAYRRTSIVLRPDAIIARTVLPFVREALERSAQ
jgi:hypothetical protein